MALPDWLLERYAAGELPPSERQRVLQALEADPAERARLEALAEDDRAVLATHPPERVLREVERRLRSVARPPASARPAWRLLPAFAVAATAALALFALQPAAGPGTPSVAPARDVRAKGDAALHVFRIRGQGQERLEDGAAVARADVLQLHYLAGGRRYGVIVSIDGAGGATLHLPEDPGGSSELAPDGSAPHGYELDAAPGFERFFFATSDAPLSAAAVLAAARSVAEGPDPRRAPLALPAGVEQWSLLLSKVTR